MSSMPRPPAEAGDSSPSVAAGEPYFVIHLRRPRPGVLVVTAAGEIDILTVGTLTDALAGALPETTVLDLSEVTLLCAAGLRALRDAADRADTERRQLRVVATTRWVSHLLALSGLDRRVPVFGSLPAALRG